VRPASGPGQLEDGSGAPTRAELAQVLLEMFERDPDRGRCLLQSGPHGAPPIAAPHQPLRATWDRAGDDRRRSVSRPVISLAAAKTTGWASRSVHPDLKRGLAKSALQTWLVRQPLGVHVVGETPWIRSTRRSWPDKRHGTSEGNDPRTLVTSLVLGVGHGSSMLASSAWDRWVLRVRRLPVIRCPACHPDGWWFVRS
jgi:hypothetical protein